MTNKDTSSAVIQDFVPKAKQYSRRGPVDLRRKVLRDQTCKAHLNFDTLQDKPPTLLKPLVPQGKENEIKEAVSKDQLPRLSCEEKTLKLRKKLERIIHKKENDHSKAIEYLTSLEKMRYTTKVLDSTKICYTIEALKLVVKDKAIVEKADSALSTIKASANEKKEVREFVEAKEEKKIEVQPEEKKEIKSYTEWRDAKKQKEESEKREHEERKKNYAQNLQEYERKKKEYEKKQREFNKKVRPAQDKKKQIPEEVPKEPAVVPDNEPAEEEQVQGAEGFVSSLKIGYWMDKLMSGVDQLSLLDKKVESMEGSVKTIDSKEDEGKKKEDDESRKKKPVSKAPETRTVKKPDIFEDDLILLTKNINKIDIKDNKSETVPKTKKVGKEELPLKPKETIVDIEQIKSVLDNHIKHDVTIVIKNLKTLSSLQVSIETLQTTKIGVAVNNLRKSTDNLEIVEISKTILKSWKKLLPNEKSTENEANVPEKPASDGKKSAEDIRKYCKDKLKSALKSNDTLTDSCKIRIESLAAEIEAEIFAIYKETSSKYRHQVNSRYFNILKNTTLQENLLLGNLDPKDVATMNYEELANEQVKEVRAKWTTESLKTMPDNHVAGKFCTCRICLPPWIKS